MLDCWKFAHIQRRTKVNSVLASCVPDCFPCIKVRHKMNAMNLAGKFSKAFKVD